MNKTPIVLQLQELASDGEVPLGDVLRKSRMVATKLGLKDFNEWLDREINGYDYKDEIPQYRIIFGDLRADNPMNGIAMPIRFEPKIMNELCRAEVRQAIGSIESILDSADLRQTSVSVFPINRGQDPLGDGIPCKTFAIPYLRVAPSQVFGILDAVRSKILDWALDLESKGIVGDGLRFNPKEVERAGITYNIGTAQGFFGEAHHSTVNQRFKQTVVSGSIESLKDNLRSVGISDEDISALETAIKTDPKPTDKQFGPAVSNWFGSMCGKMASGAYDLAIGTGGELLSNILWTFYGPEKIVPFVYSFVSCAHNSTSSLKNQ